MSSFSSRMDVLFEAAQNLKGERTSSSKQPKNDTDVADKSTTTSVESRLRSKYPGHGRRQGYGKTASACWLTQGTANHQKELLVNILLANIKLQLMNHQDCLNNKGGDSLNKREEVCRARLHEPRLNDDCDLVSEYAASLKVRSLEARCAYWRSCWYKQQEKWPLAKVEVVKALKLDNTYKEYPKAQELYQEVKAKIATLAPFATRTPSEPPSLSRSLNLSSMPNKPPQPTSSTSMSRDLPHEIGSNPTRTRALSNEDKPLSGAPITRPVSPNSVASIWASKGGNRTAWMTNKRDGATSHKTPASGIRTRMGSFPLEYSESEGSEASSNFGEESQRDADDDGDECGGVFPMERSRSRSTPSGEKSDADAEYDSGAHEEEEADGAGMKSRPRASSSRPRRRPAAHRGSIPEFPPSREQHENRGRTRERWPNEGEKSSAKPASAE